jgi:hypothetical protein
MINIIEPKLREPEVEIKLAGHAYFERALTVTSHTSGGPNTASTA